MHNNHCIQKKTHPGSPYGPADMTYPPRKNVWPGRQYVPTKGARMARQTWRTYTGSPYGQADITYQPREPIWPGRHDVPTLEAHMARQTWRTHPGTHQPGDTSWRAMKQPYMSPSNRGHFLPNHVIAIHEPINQGTLRDQPGNSNTWTHQPRDTLWPAM